jgi:hypothetical protein
VWFDHKGLFDALLQTQIQANGFALLVSMPGLMMQVPLWASGEAGPQGILRSVQMSERSPPAGPGEI